MAQNGRGFDVALSRGALDVMGAGRSCSPSRRQRLGAPLVGAEPPPAGGGLVDRAPDERMPEAEAPRHVGVPDEIEPKELVDCVHRLTLGRRGSCGRQLGLERIPCHCRSLQDTAPAVGQQA